MKKGFTLVELLAVIVILVIISLIAVPIVINIIEDTKINSVKASASTYLKAAKVYISNAELSKVKIVPGVYPIMGDGNICMGIMQQNECNGDVIKIKTKGNKPNGGKIIIDENNNIELNYLKQGIYIYYKNSNNNYIVEKEKINVIESNGEIITLDSSKIPYLTNYKIYGNSVQNSTPTVENPSIIQSVGNLITDTNNPNYGKYNIQIKVIGKNLFDIKHKTESNEVLSFSNNSIRQFDFNKYYFGLSSSNYFSSLSKADYYLEGDSIFVSSSSAGYGLGVPLRVKNNTTYVFSAEKKSTISIGKYDINGNFLGQVLSSKITTSENTDIITMVLRPDVTEYKEYKNIQLEEGAVATEYEPYTEKVYNIYLDEPLRCVSGICDELDFKSQTITRRVASIRFNGVANGWKANWPQSVTENSMGIFYSNDDISLDNGSAKFINKMTSSHFKYLGSGAALNTQNDSLIGKFSSASTSTPLYIGFKVPFTTKDAWITYLQEQYNNGTPVEVNYVLKNEDTQLIELPEIKINKDISNIIIFTSVKPSKILIEYNE